MIEVQILYKCLTTSICSVMFSDILKVLLLEIMGKVMNVALETLSEEGLWCISQQTVK